MKTILLSKLVKAKFIGCLLAMSFAVDVQAATYTVINTNDSGPGSLRQAVAIANSTLADDTIVFDISGCPDGICTITLTSNDFPADHLAIDPSGNGSAGNLTLSNMGVPGSVIISGNNSGRIFLVSEKAKFAINGLVLTNGRSGTFGGGMHINRDAMVQIGNSTLRDNSTVFGGGAIFAEGGSLEITSSELRDNSAVFYGSGGGSGGAIFTRGSLLIRDSTIASNIASYFGGGIVFYPLQGTQHAARFINCTVSGNTVNGASSGGGVGGAFFFGYVESPISFTNVTVTDNFAAGYGGAVDTAGVISISVRNSIFSGNTAGIRFEDIASDSTTVNDLGNNLFGVPAYLGPLAQNGGRTRTHALLEGSPAINSGNNCVIAENGCGDNNTAIPTDQRGSARVGTVDIGAFESNYTAPPVPPPPPPGPSSVPAPGQFGQLDPAFGEGGRIFPPLGNPYTQFIWNPDGVIQQDGKIVRSQCESNPYTDEPRRLVLERYLADGLLDTAFGVNGKASSTLMCGGKLAVQPDGKIVVANSRVIRYLPDGQPDKQFGMDGSVSVSEFLSVADVAVQPNGKIVLAGNATQNGVDVFAVVRITSTGALDDTFGTNGIKTTQFKRYSYLAALIIQPDGQIVVGGETADFSDYLYSSLALVRYDQNGSPDLSFGDSGKVVISRTWHSFFTGFGGALSIQPDNKLIVAGRYSLSRVGDGGLLMRFDPNGSIDYSFGKSGMVLVAQPIGLTSVAIQSNGKIVAGGWYNASQAIARFFPNGALDFSFGTGGITITEFPFFNCGIDYSYITALGLQGDRNIVSIGAVEGYEPLKGYPCGAYPTIARHVGTSRSKTPFDFDGDGKTDISVYRPSDGNWYVLNSGANSPSYSISNWGNSTDLPVPADFDNDGKTDVAVYRPTTGEWFIMNSHDSSFAVVNWGTSGDKPIPRDFDGDVKADLAVYRPSNGNWYILRSSGGWDIVQWGASSDVPVAGNYDYDNKADIAVYRPSNGTWFVMNSTGGGGAYSWGIAGDRPISADYDGDGRQDIAMYRPSDGNWYILKSSTNYDQYDIINWGNSTDIPVPGDYDGDGKDDAAVYRASSGEWFILKSTSGFIQTNWGIPGDAPLPAVYIP